MRVRYGLRIIRQSLFHPTHAQVEIETAIGQDFFHEDVEESNKILLFDLAATFGLFKHLFGRFLVEHHVKHRLLQRVVGQGVPCRPRHDSLGKVKNRILLRSGFTDQNLVSQIVAKVAPVFTSLDTLHVPTEEGILRDLRWFSVLDETVKLFFEQIGSDLVVDQLWEVNLSQLGVSSVVSFLQSLAVEVDEYPNKQPIASRVKLCRRFVLTVKDKNRCFPATAGDS